MGANFAVVYATRALLTLPLPNGTAPTTANFKNVAPFYLNETFPYDWYRVPYAIGFPPFLADIGNYFLFHPQELGTTYEGRFVPFNVTIPTAPADIGCLGLTLLASGAPNEAEATVQAADALFNQIFAPALKASGCDVSDYANNGGHPYYESSKEDIAGGSGSGITHQGEFDKKSHKPTGKSKGEPTRKKRATFQA